MCFCTALAHKNNKEKKHVNDIYDLNYTNMDFYVCAGIVFNYQKTGPRLKSYS